jgi:predicted outer membrane repeat protein
MTISAPNQKSNPVSRKLSVVIVKNAADRGAGSLRAAIASAKAGDTLKFAAGLAGKTIKLTSGQLELSNGKSLTIDGTGVANLTLSGNNASRIFYLNSNQDRPITLSLKNITLANAYVADQGGAIKGEHKAVIKVDGVKFKNNTADQGGGAIFSASESSLTVTRSQFDGNKAIAGNNERGAGAIAFLGSGVITIRDSQFTNNRGINGAAINSLNGKLTVDNCKFTNNDTSAAQYGTGDRPSLRGYGGAIYTDRGNDTIVIKKSTFQNNSAKASGGAVYLFADPEDVVSIESSVFTSNKATGLAGGEGGKGGAITQLRDRTDPRGKLTIAHSTIANNQGYDQGGGLWVNHARTTITNSTFSGNKLFGTDSSNVGGGMTLYSDTDIVNTTIANNNAGWVGGGISADDVAKVTVKNTIFYKNTADNGTQNYGIQQHTNRELTDNGSNIQFPPKKTNNFNDYNATAKVKLVDPKLDILKDNGGSIPTHALLKGSPAINSGIKTGAPTTDERGFKRTDGKVDMGAFEFGASSISKRVGARTHKSRSNATDQDPLIGRSGSQTLVDADRDRLLHFHPDRDLAMVQRLQTPDQTGKQALKTHEAVFFQRGSRIYLAVNDSSMEFESDRVLDGTGVQMRGQDTIRGVLQVKNYFT